ncbi:MAG: hypothetical protein LAP85_16140 [Acidobacteriia bacterium]|nr:hypothetical protein [Terriglobia bacterium]
MRKCTVIATCLMNSRFINKLEDAEATVEKIFRTEFPESDFVDWNREIDDRAAQNIIKSVGCASRINVRRFIEDFDI